MTRAKKWAEIRRQRIGPDQEAAVEAHRKELRNEMALHELRRALGYTQAQLAEQLGGDQQSAISRLEKQPDFLLSTLRRYVEAMGGELELIAKFREGTVRITSPQEDGAEDSELQHA
jgi:transcriptional regulator with XRE-family HTH domain